MDYVKKILFLLFPPFLLVQLINLSTYFHVFRTGTCPGGPPDIKPYACTLWEAFTRLTFGPFVLPVLLFLFLFWIVAVFLGEYAVQKFRGKKAKKPAFRQRYRD